MSKLVINRNNYEDIMFNLLENTYNREETDILLDQILADPLLSFEWSQWKKAMLAESTEVYRANEFEFIESLTKTEERKFSFYVYPSAALVIIGLLGVLYLAISGNESTIQQNSKFVGLSAQIPKIHLKKEQVFPVFTPNNTPLQRRNIASIQVEKTEEKIIDIQQVETIQTTKNDSLVRPVIFAENKSRYTIKIEENQNFNLKQDTYQMQEKRYTLTDVLNGKDGIRLSKFMENSKSRIITDKQTQKVYIEYTAEDNSILILVLAE